MTMPEATPVELATLRWGAQDAQPAVLLLHGLTSSAGTWWQVASELADRGCSVTAADLRGHGSSPRTTRYRHADHAADVLQLSPHGNHARPWDLVIGHSLGGAVAVAAASRRPHWTHALLLLDPVLALSPDDHEELLGGLLAELGQHDPEALLRQHPAWHPEDATQKVAAARLVGPNR
jgi:pimeloyl-ACP methyl ester carboxylesterase